MAEWPAAGMWGQWAITQQGVYFLKSEGSDPGLNPSIQFLDLATGQRRQLGIMTKRPVFADGGMAVSPDGKRLHRSMASEEVTMFAGLRSIALVLAALGRQEFAPKMQHSLEHLFRLSSGAPGGPLILAIPAAHLRCPGCRLAP